MKTFIEFLNESGPNSIKIRGRTLAITKAPRASNDQIVWVNVRQFDKAWKKSDMYIGKNGSGGIRGRYARFELFIVGGTEELVPGSTFDVEPAESLELSEVHVSEEGEISFTNGRHRFAWLRDQGLTKIPVTMDKESVKQAKLFKYH